jgi:sugar phosphate permease
MSPAKPTRIRYLILGMSMAMYFITFLDRVNISVAAPAIVKEYGFNTVQMGVIFGAFTLSYAVFQMPGGWLGDRIGSRVILPLLVTWWSLFTAATALASGYRSFLSIRFIFGMGEAGAFPATATALSRWLRPEERGFSQGMLQSATRIGSAATPPLIATIIAFAGWRAAFVACAFLGVAWAIGWWLIYRNRPEEHPWVNDAERHHILSAQPQRKEVVSTPWKAILTSKTIWALCVSYFCLIYTTYIYFNWFPTYLMKARNFPLLKMGVYASFPFIAGAIANTAGGAFSDFLIKKSGNIKWARRSIPLVGMIVLAFFMVPGALVESAYVSLVLLSLALACSEFGIGIYWATALDVADQHAGTVSGLMNTFGNLGGFFSPIVFGIIVDRTQSWSMPFMVASCVSVVGALFWLFIDPTASLKTESGG